MSERKPFTHAAFAMKRESRTAFRWLEIGAARIESNERGHHIYLDRLPVGGFTGHIYLSPIGVTPPDPAPEPQRPAAISGAGSQDEEF